MSRALPIVLSAVLVGGVAGASLLPATSQAATGARSGRVSAQADTAITPISPGRTTLTDLTHVRQQAAAAKAGLARAAAAKAAAAQAAKAAADARALRARELARASRSRRVVVYSGDPRGIAQSMLASRGWSGQFGCLDSLWSKESGWNVHASNGSSGAYGIPQALPGSKMASAGSDWATNPATQIRWGLDYIASSYGSPCAAWQHSQATNWY